MDIVVQAADPYETDVDGRAWTRSCRNGCVTADGRKPDEARYGSTRRRAY
jgi:hypothetical protein